MMATGSTFTQGNFSIAIDTSLGENVLLFQGLPGRRNSILLWPKTILEV